MAERQHQGISSRTQECDPNNEDGQEIVMRYMEKHEIFQLFLQITETLLSEQPDDPLKNILEQVQELINKREIAEKHHQN
uniref:Uncharacterized protein n=1 Tax=Eptatretus burgeri TaxID=7764 RepID=A0A8C4Q4T9_EPTBU